MTLTDIQDLLQQDLSAVEGIFERELRSDQACVNALVRHLARFRGKMLRPTLVLLSGRAAGEITDAHLTVGAVVEMAHMASLVHDDVLDEAELRRRGATINHLRGNEAAVLLGDYLISHSYHLCSSLDSQYASRLVAAATNQLCEGELLQLHNRGNYRLDEPTYLEIIRRKTAALTAVSCELGASFAGAEGPTVESLHDYGLNLGMAFQIQDDILDIVGEASLAGKTLGTDIEKGKLTLPLIRFLSSAADEHRRLLSSLLEDNLPDKVERIRNLILLSDALAYTRRRAQQYIDQAQASLAPLPDNEARRALETMADFVINRPL